MTGRAKAKADQDDHHRKVLAALIARRLLDRVYNRAQDSEAKAHAVAREISAPPPPPPLSVCISF
jgi:hypothetical protein